MKKSDVFRRVYWRRWCSRKLTGWPSLFLCRSTATARRALSAFFSRLGMESTASAMILSCWFLVP